jgi:cytochrome c oxidase subunit 2
MLPKKAGAKAEAKTEEKVVETKEKSVATLEKKPEKSAKKGAEKVEHSAEMAVTDLVAHGKSVYEKNCSSCHGADGAGMPGLFPALKASPVVTGDIKKQVELMTAGKGMMPGFGTTLSADDFAAVVTYTRNDLGNSVGDSLQPSAVKSLQSAKK